MESFQSTCLNTKEDAQTTSCYQILNFTSTGIIIYQTTCSKELETLLEVWTRFFELTNSPNQLLVQYVEPFPINLPIPAMDMPPRPQDLDPLTVAMPDSPEDAQKLKAYLDGDS